MKFTRAIQLTLVSIFTLATVGCNSSKYKNYDEQINELNKLMSTNDINVSSSFQVNNKITPLVNLYSDEEKIIQAYKDSDRSFREVFLKDSYILEGHGFAVFTGLNNESLFPEETGNVDMRDFIVEIDKNSNSDLLITKINYKRMATLSKIDIESGELYDIYQRLNVDLEKLPFYVYYKDGCVSGFSIVLDEYTKTSLSSGFVCRIDYEVFGYGDRLIKQSIDIEQYKKIDMQTMLIVQKDVANYYNQKPSLIFQTYGNFFINGPKDDDVIGRFGFIDNEENMLDITFKETSYNEETQECTYFFAGKAFVITIRTLNVLNELDTLEMVINHNHEDSIIYDYARARIVMASENKIKIIDYSSLNVIKEYDVEGEILNIINHSDVYHIMTLTEGTVSEYVKDTSCKGNIYIINTTSLDILDVIQVNTCPFNTTIDNRGNIIISPASGQNVKLYIFDINEKTLSTLKGYSVWSKCYLDYNSDEDFVIAKSPDGRCVTFHYEDGQYVARLNDLSKYASEGWTVYLKYGSYLVSYGNIIDASDWRDLKTTELIRTVDRFATIFCDNNCVYILNECIEDHQIIENTSSLIRISFKDGEITQDIINISLNYKDISFGLIKDDLVYLYDYKNQEFHIFDISNVL